MSAKEIESKLRQRIATLSHAGAGMAPSRVHIARSDYDALFQAGYAGKVTGKIYIDGTLLVPIGDSRKRRAT